MYHYNAETTLDPLRISKVPESVKELNLDYVTYTHRDRKLWPTSMFVAPLMTMIILIGVRVFHLNEFGTKLLYAGCAPAVIISVISFLIILFLQFCNDQKVINSNFMRILCLFFYGSVSVSLLIIDPLSHVLALAFSFCLAVSFSEKLLIHTLQIFVADASFPREFRNKIKQLCSRISLGKRLLNPLAKYTWSLEPVDREIANYGLYDMYYTYLSFKTKLVTFFSVSLIVALIVGVIYKPLAFCAAYLVFATAVFVQVYRIVSTIKTDLRQDPEHGSLAPLSLYWESVLCYFNNFSFVLNSWWGYNAHRNLFPGIFHSPYGEIGCRRWLYVITLVGFIGASYMHISGPLYLIDDEIIPIIITLFVLLLVLFLPIVLTFFAIISMFPQMFFLYAKDWWECLSEVRSTRKVPKIKYLQPTDGTIVLPAWGNYLNYVVDANLAYAYKQKDYVPPILIGTSAHGDYPVFIARNLPHTKLDGGTRSGKSVTITQVITQLILYGDSVVIIDMKGDRALFEAARIAAKNQGAEFKWFTNSDDAETYVFNPFSQSYMKQAPKRKRVELLMRSLGLNHGTDWSKNHFTMMNFDVLTKVFDFLPEPVISFKDLEFHLARLEQLTMRRRRTRFNNKQDEEEISLQFKLYDTPAQKEHAQDVRSICRLLSAYKNLNLTLENGSPEAVANAIDMADPFQKQCVYYFSIDSQQETIAGLNIAKLAIWSLLTAATFVDRKKHVNVFLDEFQKVVSRDTKSVLDMSAGFDISVLLSNQSMGQLRELGTDLETIVRDNTDLKITYTEKDATAKRNMEKASGEMLYMDSGVRTNDSQHNITHNTMDYSKGYRIQRELDARQDAMVNADYGQERTFIGNRFTANTITEATARLDECIVQYSRNTPGSFAPFDGHPIILNTYHFIPEIEHKKRDKTAFPSASEYPGTICNVVDTQLAAKEEAHLKMRSEITTKLDKAQSVDEFEQFFEPEDESQ